MLSFLVIVITHSQFLNQSRMPLRSLRNHSAQFSTLAESKLYRSWGMDIIGMTNLQEAKLAREAEICYSTLALVTDYDCWHPDHDSVTVEMVIANLVQNAKTAQQIIAGAVEQLVPEPGLRAGQQHCAAVPRGNDATTH